MPGGAQHSSAHTVVIFSTWTGLIRFLPCFPPSIQEADGGREGGVTREERATPSETRTASRSISGCSTRCEPSRVP